MIANLLCLFMLTGASAGDLDVALPERVSVMPVFFIPKGEIAPTKEQKLRFTAHLKWTQKRYRELLGDRDTFQIAKEVPDLCQGKKPQKFYREQPEDGAPEMVGELLDHYKLNRFNCPYVFAIIVMNPQGDWPQKPGGRPCNGGFNRGCGIVLVTSRFLDQVPYFQSTLQHELGHAFGLRHVDDYGYDQQTSLSIMSYNHALGTNSFQPSTTPGILIPEDLRSLALNRRCFPTLRFDSERDVPDGYKLHRVIWLVPMKIVGHPPYEIEVTTSSGSTFGSKPSNVVQCEILPSSGPGVTYDASRMWTSDAAPSGWVSLDVTFPVVVTLNAMRIYTEHSGQYHRAHRARIQVQKGNEFEDVVERDLEAADATVSMSPTRGQTWRVHLLAGPSKIVVVRGLRFASSSGEIFPPAVPCSNN
ncbi:MAG: hypothetical protein NTY19_15785 [Planctomycetota bacterium]|nr:hypothetical protein [Planctomycetota bacterium]